MLCSLFRMGVKLLPITTYSLDMVIWRCYEFAIDTEIKYRNKFVSNPEQPPHITPHSRVGGIRPSQI